MEQWKFASHILNMGMRWRSVSFKPGLLDVWRKTYFTLWIRGFAGHSRTSYLCL